MRATPDRETAHVSDLFAAIGAEPRLRIVRLLLTAHPDGMIAGDIGAALSISASTLSHHLDRLKREHIVNVRRQATFLWYTANVDALERLLKFLFTECCVKNQVISAEKITRFA